ncbi:MAG TPA: serine/threonine-protein kinase [Planctomycetia bacterium]|nr:serine/threonine-protein kinase [Planctomycetia bacterium]
MTDSARSKLHAKSEQTTTDVRAGAPSISDSGPAATALVPERQLVALKLGPSGDSLPQLTGEIRDLVLIRLREVGVLVTVNWTLVLLLCLSRADRVFNIDHLGAACLAAMAAAPPFYLAVWVFLRGRPRHSLAQLRGVEALFLWGSVFCSAWLRYAAVGHALDAAPVDRHLVLYASAMTNLVWMTVIVVYGAFAPNTWRRLVVMIAAVILALVATETAIWFGRAAAHHETFIANALITFLAISLAAGTALYGSFKLGAAQEEAESARRQLRELGHYRLIRLLGSGGMGEVHLAEHALLRRPCAIKLIRPTGADAEKQTARFEREVQATAALTHPNTIEIYDYGRTEDGVFYYVMEYLPGGALDHIVERHGPLPPARAIHLLRQVCGALAEAHAAGLIHRDVKPANIIVCNRGGVHDVVKLLDFGLVRAIAPGLASDRLTHEGAIAGTPAYMSAEQSEGSHSLDGRSDIYSLGAVAYFLLTGQPPFPKWTALQVLFAHAREPVRPPSELRPDLPPDLEAVILKCMEKNRDLRYQSALDLDRALAACAVNQPWTEAQAARWWHDHCS